VHAPSKPSVPSVSCGIRGRDLARESRWCSSARSCRASPTTTFLFVAVWCFPRSSNRAHAWLLEHRRLGPYVQDHMSGKGMPVRSKVIAPSTMWLTCGLSAWLFVPPLWGKGVVLACAAAGRVFC
jgi:uncharacterized membrane protein YbaN (DUF454 family)